MAWNALPQEISEFCDELWKVSATERTADALIASIGAFNHSWRKDKSLRSGGGVPIPPPRVKALFPKACEVSDAELTFFFELGADIEEHCLPARSDFQVCVRGLAAYDNAVHVELEDHWRIDTHAFGGGECVEPHPHVHFQRGGHAQDRFAHQRLFVPGSDLTSHHEGSWKSLLQSPGPRIPMPPFCPILAIDYAIGQHDGTVLRQLRALPEYSAVVRRAQTRLWGPFFDRLSSNSVLRKKWLGNMLVE